MPLQWKRGTNPYVVNYFGVLGVGPNTPDRQIAALGRELRKKAEQPEHAPELAGERLTPHQISEASTRLCECASRAAELPLVHPEARQDQRQLKELKRQLRSTAVLPRTQEPMPLRHPLAILWFLPRPEPEAAQWPDLDDFDLVKAGDPADLELDIVFDS